ncbi:MAG: hypothetical protein LLG05_18700 [Porphyromonadaceae bacterium]|nr:hypothetical protein [Porphyromonadaceae bacterium]
MREVLIKWVKWFISWVFVYWGAVFLFEKACELINNQLSAGELDVSTRLACIILAIITAYKISGKGAE